jgi:hypothetical protein
MVWTGPAPAPTGGSCEVDLTGHLVAWGREQPILLRMLGSKLWYLAAFSTESQLRELYARVGVKVERIKQIDDGPQFMSSFEGHDELVVIVDPYFTDEGRIRWLQVPMPGSVKS